MSAAGVRHSARPALTESGESPDSIGHALKYRMAILAAVQRHRNTRAPKKSRAQRLDVLKRRWFQTVPLNRLHIVSDGIPIQLFRVLSYKFVFIFK